MTHETRAKEILQWLVKEIAPQRIPGRLQIQLVHKIIGVMVGAEEFYKGELSEAIKVIGHYGDRRLYSHAFGECTMNDYDQGDKAREFLSAHQKRIEGRV